jgi:hypothetical protein
MRSITSLLDLRGLGAKIITPDFSPLQSGAQELRVLEGRQELLRHDPGRSYVDCQGGHRWCGYGEGSCHRSPCHPQLCSLLAAVVREPCAHYFLIWSSCCISHFKTLQQKFFGVAKLSIYIFMFRCFICLFFMLQLMCVATVFLHMLLSMLQHLCLSVSPSLFKYSIWGYRMLHGTCVDVMARFCVRCNINLMLQWEFFSFS